MSAPTVPKIYRSLAIFVLDGVAYYFNQDGAKITCGRDTVGLADDGYGTVLRVSQGIRPVDIAFTPVALLRTADLVKTFPFSGTDSANWYSKSIFVGAGAFKSKNGEVLTYTRAGILKPPSILCHPTKPLFGQMTVRCLHQADVSPATTAALSALTTATFSDATYAPSLMGCDNYRLAIGTRSAPYATLTSRNGFAIEPMYETFDVTDESHGVADTFWRSIGWRLAFEPNGLTPAEFAALGNWDGSGAITAGQRGPSNAGESLVITGDPIDITLNNMLCTKSDSGRGVSQDANQGVEFETSQMTFTTPNEADPLIEFTVNLA